MQQNLFGCVRTERRDFSETVEDEVQKGQLLGSGKDARCSEKSLPLLVCSSCHWKLEQQVGQTAFVQTNLTVGVGNGVLREAIGGHKNALVC